MLSNKRMESIEAKCMMHESLLETKERSAANQKLRLWNQKVSERHNV